MNAARPGLLLPACLLGLLACTPASEEIHQSEFHALGTRIELSLRAPEQDAQPAAEAVKRAFTAGHARWDGWGGGALGRVNLALTAGQSVPVPPELEPGLARALEYSRQSQGRFHPGVGVLTETWGFHRPPWPQTPPQPGAVAAAVARIPPPEAMTLEQGVLQVDRPGVRLDPGGFVKGLLLEEAREILLEAGIEHALINAGGDVAVLGDAGDRPWRLGILDPVTEGVLARVELDGSACLSTSGNYERGFTAGGQWFHHLLDPQLGYPAGNAAAATVLGEDCRDADATATALFVARAKEWPTVASRMGQTRVMRVASDGRVTMTGAMQEKIEFEDRSPEVRVHDPDHDSGETER